MPHQRGHYASDVFSYCYWGGTLGRWTTYWALFTPLFMWHQLQGFAVQTRELYFVTLAYQWWLTLGVVTLLRSYDPLSLAPAHDSCSSSDAGGPSYALALFAHYVCMSIVHRLYWRLPWRPLQTAYLLALSVALPLVLWLSGNAHVTHLAQGTGVGVAVALVFALLVYRVLMPYVFDRLMRLAFVHTFLGMRNSHDIARAWYYYEPRMHSKEARDALTPPSLLPEPIKAHITHDGLLPLDIEQHRQPLTQMEFDCASAADTITPGGYHATLHTLLLI